jgi:beta-glucanase (GH16 family)
LICSSQPTPPPALTPPSGYTANQLIFEDRFLSSSLDTSKWIPQFANQNGVVDTSVPTPYSANPVGGYDAEFFDPGHIATGAGLAITATTDTSIAGYNWRSGCITTHGLFSFTGGYAQFRVKSPDSSSGMWAVIYFLEGGGEIDLQGSGNIGTATPSPNPNQTMVSSVNPDGSNSTLVDTGTDLSAAYHVYGMEYIPGVSVKTYLDGNLIAQFTQNIPTGAFTIVIGLQVAQSQASPWHTIYSPATPSPSEFDISDAQVYSLP